MSSSLRITKINEEIKKLLGEIIRRDIDPVWGIISVTKVKTSADLHYSQISISAYRHTDEIVELLNEKKVALNRLLAEKLTIKFTPKIFFIKDDSIDYANHIQDLLEKIKKQDQDN
ncbi:MAG TPA: 30S ribosome-binding factor RbfA [bacterium]|nr:30S ribosome-binding factor RbfA [bacterium]HPN67529.1 30S ribosome-binding factor RbfA [bacterium]